MLAFAQHIFTHPQVSEETHLRQLIAYEDRHYRAVFDLRYFGSAAPPTKSQWNSLKKKLRRYDKRVFVFKEAGTTACEPSSGAAECGYLEFGFFEH